MPKREAHVNPPENIQHSGNNGNNGRGAIGPNLVSF
jgi:hypothetical protein